MLAEWLNEFYTTTGLGPLRAAVWYFWDLTSVDGFFPALNNFGLWNLLDDFRDSYLSDWRP